MLRARNNLHFQFLGKSNFRGVVTVDGDALENFPEVAFKLGVRFGNGVAVLGADGTIGHSGIVDSAKLHELLLGGGVGKILAVERLTLLVNAGDSVEKARAFLRSGPFRQDDVDKFIDARALGAGSVGGGNDLIDHGDDGVV